MNTSHPGNIGAVARAMKNMGVHDLCLVGPYLFPHPDADSRASGAEDILEQATVVHSLEEALADVHIVVGASARHRTLPWPVCTPAELAEHVSRSSTAQRFAIVFGRESSGLTNDELARCNMHLRIPANPGYTSLNLGMAVQIVCYELYARALRDRDGTPERSAPCVTSAGARSGDPASGSGPGTGQAGHVTLPAYWDEPAARVQDVEHMIRSLEQTLIAVGFHDPARPRQLMPRLRRLFQRVEMDRMEVNILEGFLAAARRRAERRPGQSEPPEAS